MSRKTITILIALQLGMMTCICAQVWYLRAQQGARQEVSLVTQEKPPPEDLTAALVEAIELPITPTPAPPTSTPAPPSAIVTAGPLNLRRGPGTNYDILGKLQEDESLEIVARNAEGDWLQVLSPAGVGGWVAAGYVQTNVPLDAVQVVAALPPSPSPVPLTPTPLPPTATPPPMATPTSIFMNRIVFETRLDGNQELYLINPDGTNLVNLTNHWADDGSPAWSPDGTKIAYTSWRYNPLGSDRLGRGVIFVMNSDGSNPIQLTEPSIHDEWPTWSPDGTKIAFETERDGNREIYVMNADGSNPVNLTNHPAHDRNPDWSPDGTKIAFSSNRAGNYEIYVMNADGSNPINLTWHPAGDARDRYPAWSPDGTRIAFESNRDGNQEIYVMNSDGSNPVNLTNTPQKEWLASWSPDGTRLVFYAKYEGDTELYIMNSDGSNVIQITHNDVSDGFPAWAP